MLSLKQNTISSRARASEAWATSCGLEERRRIFLDPGDDGTVLLVEKKPWTEETESYILLAAKTGVRLKVPKTIEIGGRWINIADALEISKNKAGIVRAVTRIQPPKHLPMTL